MVATYAWLCGAEFPSQRLRSYTFGLATSIGFFGAWLATFTAPYFINPDSLNWGPKYGYIWFPSCLIGAIWTFFFLPEVQNRTFEEIDEMVSSTHASSSPKSRTNEILPNSSRHASQRANSESTSALARWQRWQRLPRKIPQLSKRRSSWRGPATRRRCAGMLRAGPRRLCRISEILKHITSTLGQIYMGREAKIPRNKCNTKGSRLNRLIDC